MNLLKTEMDEDFNAVGFKNQRRSLRTLPQTQKNKTDRNRDIVRKALASGKRISKNGKVYWETRANRSDVKGTKL